MAIDLSACIGLQRLRGRLPSREHIPVVGKEQVAAGREMHWLAAGSLCHTGTAEKARGEYYSSRALHALRECALASTWCPVEATVHSSEGLKRHDVQPLRGHALLLEQFAPTRYGGSIFFHYADYHTPTLRLQYNPDVTVRSRGVMEKCSYCVQRIRHASVDADVEGRRIADGEVLTACQAACPAKAISFGDINDPASEVNTGKTCR